MKTIFGSVTMDFQHELVEKVRGIFIFILHPVVDKVHPGTKIIGHCIN